MATHTTEASRPPIATQQLSPLPHADGGGGSLHGAAASQRRIVLTRGAEWESGAGNSEQLATLPAQEPQHHRSMAAQTAESLVAALGGSPSERAAAYASLEATQDGAIGAKCVAALAGVLAKPASEVDAAEHRRCCLALAHLASLDPEQLGGEWYKETRFLAAWAAGNAADVALSVGAEQLTKEHARTLAAGMACMPAMWAKGYDGIEAAGSLDFMADFFEPMESGPFRAKMADQAKRTRIVALALDLLREDRAELSEAELAGVWALIMWMTYDRPAVAAHAAREGMFGLAVEDLRTGSPADWVSIARNPSGRFSFVFYAMQDATLTLDTEQKRSLAATPRLLDVFLDLLKAYESAGPVGANVMSVYVGTLAFFEMCGALFEFSQINKTAVRGVASQIRYLLDHPLVMTKAKAWSTTQAAVRHPMRLPLDMLPLIGRWAQGMLAATVFGRDEDDSGMELRQRDVDEQLVCFMNFMSDPWPMNENWSETLKHIRYSPHPPTHTPHTPYLPPHDSYCFVLATVSRTVTSCSCSTTRTCGQLRNSVCSSILSIREETTENTRCRSTCARSGSATTPRCCGSWRSSPPVATRCSRRLLCSRHWRRSGSGG